MSAHIIITGNVGKDLEVFTFGSGGEGFRFDVAVSSDQRGEQVTHWFKIATFGRVKDQAKTLHDDGKLVQGAKVMVMGSFSPREYTTRNGETRMSFDSIANTIEVLYAPQRQQPTVEDQYSEGFEYADDDDQPNF